VSKDGVPIHPRLDIPYIGHILNPSRMEIELIVLLTLQILANAFFGRFEGETPGWQKAMKWLALLGITLGLYRLVGHYSLIFPLGIVVLALSLHFYGCKKNGIHPFKATPRRKYYEMRGWEWKE
jgi:hypothetical protein